MTLSLKSLIRALRRWLIRSEMNRLQCHVAQIRSDRADDFEFERICQTRYALLKSALRNLEAQ